MVHGAHLSQSVTRALAVKQLVCVRPRMRRVTDRATGQTTVVAIRCGSTRDAKCPPCATTARRLRMTQCTESWHRDDEPEHAFTAATADGATATSRPRSCPGARSAPRTTSTPSWNGWLTGRANVRRMRVIRARPVDVFDADRAAMVPLPPVAPATGLTHRVRLGRDYYVRIASNDYSVDPRAIGRFVDVLATPIPRGRDLRRSGRGRPRPLLGTGGHGRGSAHKEPARALRADLAEHRRTLARTTRAHPDGHVVAIRALRDYDALFGVDSNPAGQAGLQPREEHR